MRRRAPRASFVVTFALAAAATAGGCGGKDNRPVFNNPPGPSSDGGGNGDGSSAGCPAEPPTIGAPCDLPSSASCSYLDGGCYESPLDTACQQGTWSLLGSCNPPVPAPPFREAGPDVDDAASDVHDGGPDGEGQDAGRD